MKPLLRRCTKCGRYTFEQACPKCGGDTTLPHPPRFSLEDRYATYRVRALYEERSAQLEG